MDFEAGMENLERMLLDAKADPTDLPLSVLKTITEKFSKDRQVGKGGFAIVYEGRLRNGVVAVKRLCQTLEMHEKKFNQEVACLMKVRHKNIVRFLGYCADTQGKMSKFEGKEVMADIRQRLLCFEFMPNGSLKGYITNAYQVLEWSTCYKLIKGVCEGLHYLHQKKIVHLDLKPANILLDYNMVPKIADFGLSRCFDENKYHTITSTVFGSVGYLAPEAYSGVITLMSDIYSLGVIIIEILTGQKGYIPIENVLESWSNRLKTSDEADTQLEQVRVCCEIGLQCIDSNPKKRLDADRVIEKLGAMETRCSSIESESVTSPVTHGDTRLEPGVLFEVGIECFDPNSERRPITPRIIDGLDKMECTSSATHQEKKGSTESQNPTPKTRSPLLDMHPWPLELRYALEPNKIHGLYQSSTDVEQGNVQLSGDAKWKLKDVGAKEQKKVGAHDLFDDHKKLIMKPMAMPPSGGGEKKVVEVQIKGASSAKQNNEGRVENAKGVTQGSSTAGPPVGVGGPRGGKPLMPSPQQVGITRPYIIGEGDVGFPCMDQIGGWPMSMPMDRPQMGKVQQGSGGDSPTAGFQERRGAVGGSSMPSGKQMLWDAVVDRSPMVQPQYIASPMQNHDGVDDHKNYGGGKIKGGEQPQNTKCVAPGDGGTGGLPVSISGLLSGGMTPLKNTMMRSNMIGDPWSFLGIGQMSDRPMTMGMPMDPGSATQGMQVGGRDTPSALVRATVLAGQQQQGMLSGMEVLQDAAAADNPRTQQEYMAAVVAGSPMARPQCIAPMQNHGGQDSHMNYGGGKIRGEQQNSTKQCVTPGGGARGGTGSLPVSVNGPTPPKNAMMRSNMIGDSGFPGIGGQMSGGQMTMGMPMDNLNIGNMHQLGGGGGGTTQDMPVGGRNNAPSGLVHATVAAGNRTAGMPSEAQMLQDAAAAGNLRTQQYMGRMQQQPLLVARGHKKKMH